MTNSWDSPFINYSICESTTISGNGIIQCYRLSDIVCIMSNNSYYILDPVGINLKEMHINDESSSIKNDHGIGVCYPLSIQSKFPDQFSPFNHLGFSTGHNFRGTAIRLPLRLLSNNYSLHTDFYSGKMSQLLQSFKEIFPFFRDLLIFASNIESISFKHFPIHFSKPELLYQVFFSRIAYYHFYFSRLFLL